MADSLYDFICTICEQHFEQLPDGAIEISRSYNSRVTIYKFPDGRQHALKRKRKTATLAEENTK
jgi:hypothetical protein